MTRKTARRKAIDFGDIPEHTGYHIRRAYSYFTRVFAEQGKRFDLRSQQATILTLTDRNPGISPARIADANEIKRSLVTRLVTDLENRGLIECRISKTDRRHKGLHITSEGRRFLRKVMSTFAAEVEPVLVRNLSAGEKRTLIRLLTKIYRDE
jgi:DNA-binding MarR family transcriptional regulator